MKRILSLLLVAVMIFAMAACSSTSNNATEASGSADAETTGLKIGFCVSDSTNPVFIKSEKWLTEKCAEDGNTLMVQYYETDSAKFLEICENFITANVDVMIVQDPDEQISDDVLGRAEEKGIIVCTLDTDNAHATYVQKDQNVEASHLLADVIIDNQLRIVHQIAGLLGETAAETKVAVHDLKQAILLDEEGEEETDA